MTTTSAVPGFLPSVNGLHFANRFPHEPLLRVPLGVPGRLGRLPIGDAFNGICGGMIFTVRDLFEAGCLPGPETEPPPLGSPRREYLVSRLLASFNLPILPLRYFALMSPLGANRGRVTAERSWPEVRADVDAGILSPLGLIRVLSPDPRRLPVNHQVLAYRYEADEGVITVGVYDPNHPDDDTVELTFDAGDPAAVPSYSAGDGPVFAFIRSGYRWRDPVPWRTA